jgi:phage/plasmid-associated DNA primase
VSGTNIKIEMMDACKESWLLFVEKKLDRFSKGYEMKKAYSDYKKYCQEEGYNAFSNKTFGLILDNVANKMSTTNNKTHYRY